MIEVVLNNAFGGFALNKEMADWLVSNKGWSIIKHKDYDHEMKYPINTLMELYGEYVAPSKCNCFEFRTNKELIECIRFFKAKHVNSFRERVNDFKIEKIEIRFDIENYHDGYERCSVDVISDEE